jgi:hypothetical protein
MMLGHPEAPLAPALGVPGEIAGMKQRLARIAALDDRREIED